MALALLRVRDRAIAARVQAEARKSTQQAVRRRDDDTSHYLHDGERRVRSNVCKLSSPVTVLVTRQVDPVPRPILTD